MEENQSITGNAESLMQWPCSRGFSNNLPNQDYVGKNHPLETLEK